MIYEHNVTTASEMKYLKVQRVNRRTGDLNAFVTFLEHDFTRW